MLLTVSMSEAASMINEAGYVRTVAIRYVPIP